MLIVLFRFRVLRVGLLCVVMWCCVLFCFVSFCFVSFCSGKDRRGAQVSQLGRHTDPELVAYLALERDLPLGPPAVLPCLCDLRLSFVFPLEY